ncbi:DUF4359 domain-containing protein [Fusibacter bizertensis]|uniref:DUF4359 domain-containing protein n=1 Tax=Fusibacter bizertensis TaxID=1488331 RepID=A0ABT6NE66_9FIRM|nr:DUF4359 domain-containing protein [Fusibacter bizertensis]MDH8678724.1 DUF4359 domain-containing protein [Fusibacter bizertensis]
MKLKSFLWFMIILGMFLYATNPNKNDFKEFIDSEISTKISNSVIESNSYLDEIISVITGKVVSQVADVIYERTDYIFFSYYKIEGIGFRYEYLGISKNFYHAFTREEPNVINSYFHAKKTSNISNENSENIEPKNTDVNNSTSETIELNEDEFTSRAITLKQKGKLSINCMVVDGPALDYILMDKDNFESFKNKIEFGLDNDVFVIEQGKLELNALKIITATLDAGEYYILIENGDIGQVAPPVNLLNDVAKVKIEIIIKD